MGVYVLDLDILKELKLSEERRIELEPRVRELLGTVEREGLYPFIEQRGEGLARVLENTWNRTENTYNYFDGVFGHDSEEGTKHCKRIYILVTSLVPRLGGIGSRLIKRGGAAAIHHDEGKSALPDALMRALEQPDVLPIDLRELMKVHVVTGYMIVEKATRNVPDLRGIAPMILCAHEERDGLGYIGLKGRGDKIPLGEEDEIPSLSMIISVADSYLAIARKRKYDPETPHEATVQELLRGAYLPFDKDVLRKFNEDKLDDLRNYCKRKFGGGWKEAYHQSLLMKFMDNTRFDPTSGQGRRIPEGFSWDYEEVLKAPLEVLEEAYMHVRLSPEKKYYPVVVEKFVEFMQKFPGAVRGAMQEPPKTSE